LSCLAEDLKDVSFLLEEGSDITGWILSSDLDKSEFFLLDIELLESSILILVSTLSPNFEIPNIFLALVVWKIYAPVYIVSKTENTYFEVIFPCF